jgi:hypothetical protein
VERSHDDEQRCLHCGFRNGCDQKLAWPAVIIPLGDTVSRYIQPGQPHLPRQDLDLEPPGSQLLSKPG